jgi:hypothetical protein
MKKISLSLIILAGLIITACTSLGAIKNGTLVIKEGVTEIPDAKNITKRNNAGKSIVVGSIGKYENKALTSVIFPVSLTRIGSGAFKDNNLTSLTIPNGVTSIGKEAFYNNQLISVTIPDNVTSIDEAAFLRNQLTTIIIPSNVFGFEDRNNEDRELTDLLASMEMIAIDRSVFGLGFTNAYNINGKQGGTYTRPDTNSTTWTRQ